MSQIQSATTKLHDLGIDLREFVPKSATETEWGAFQSVTNREHSENWPEDPPTPLDDIKKNLLNTPPFVRVNGFLAYRGAQPIGFVYTVILLTDENQHLIQFEIYLLPEERGKGIGSLLLNWVVADAQNHDRRLLLTSASSKIPEGDAFMEKLGGEMGLSNDVNQLLVEERYCTTDQKKPDA